MEFSEDVGKAQPGRGDEPLDELLVAPAAILEGLPDAVVAASRDGQIVFMNARAEEMFGYPREELLGQPVQALWPERMRARYIRNVQLYFSTGHRLRFSTEAWGLRRNGSEFVGEMTWGVVNTTSGPLLLAIGRDVSQRRAAEARLRAVAAMGERALAGADVADLAVEAVELVRTSLPIAAAQVRLAGRAPLASFGATPNEGLRFPIGDDDDFLVRPEDELTDQEMSLVRAVANTLATALARRRDEDQMRHEALHDPLTGLPNRTLLRDRLEHALAQSERDGRETAVLFVDLDNFKQVNDVHGHATGDAVLVEFARRLRTAVRPADTVARFGGDEFVVVCEQVDEQVVLALGRRLEAAIEAPLTVEGLPYGLSASIGIALGHHDADALMANADTAVYRAKARGRGRAVLFS
jgi:diguanylate cyclase (GGDEF)-like protein/PAS domain S-box-containing protein